VGAVVVHDAAVQLRVHPRGPEAHALRADVVDHQVDEPAVRGVGLEAVGPRVRRVGLRDLEAPEHEVGAVGAQRAVDRRPLARPLAEHDRRAGRALEPCLEPAAVGAPAEPDRVTGGDAPAGTRERGGEVPGPLRRAVARGGARSSDVVRGARSNGGRDLGRGAGRQAARPRTRRPPRPRGNPSHAMAVTGTHRIPAPCAAPVAAPAARSAPAASPPIRRPRPRRRANRPRPERRRRPARRTRTVPASTPDVTATPALGQL
jgi:hypothetical protein